MIITTKRIICLGKYSLIIGLNLTFLSAVGAKETLTFYHSDMYGSPLTATDSSGALVWKQEYNALGVRFSGTTLSDGDNTGFTGYPEDRDTGLSYARARWYNPELGRFISRDPVGINPSDVKSFNRYAYANNNPYRYVDLDGRQPQQIQGDTNGFFVNGGLFTVTTPSNPSGTTYGTAEDMQKIVAPLAEKALWGARLGYGYATERFNFSVEISSTGDFGGSASYGWVGLNVRYNPFDATMTRVRGYLSAPGLEAGLQYDAIGSSVYITNSTPISLGGDDSTTSLGGGPTYNDYFQLNENSWAIEGSPNFTGPVNP